MPLDDLMRSGDGGHRQIKESVEELTRMSRAIELPSGMNELTTFMQKFLAWTQKTASELRTYGPQPSPDIVVASHRIAPWRSMAEAAEG
jgi:hypothetical protein